MEWPQIVTTITEGNAISTVVDAPWVSVTSVNGMTGDVITEPVMENFQTNHYYPKNTIVNHNGMLYWAKNTFTSTNVFDADDWYTLDITSSKVLTGQLQKTSWRRSVVALCEVSTANNTSLNSYSSGRLAFHRYNGLSGSVEINVQAENAYGTAYFFNFDYYSNLALLGTSVDIDTAQGFRPCVFKYNDKWYGGIDVFIGNAEFNNITFDGAGNFEIFGLDYYSVVHGTTPASVLNQEVYDSLDYTKWTLARADFYSDSFFANSGRLKKPGGYIATLPDKTGTIAMTSDIPSVNNATLTIQKNGSSVATFTANASSNATANIVVPTKTSDISNDSGFITSSSLPTKLTDLTNDGNFLRGVTSQSITALSSFVTTGMIADSAITTAKINNSAVTNAKIDWSSVLSGMSDGKYILTKNNGSVSFEKEPEYRIGDILAVAVNSAELNWSGTTKTQWSGGTWTQYGPMAMTVRPYRLVITTPADEEWDVKVHHITGTVKISSAWGHSGLFQASGDTGMDLYLTTCLVANGDLYLHQESEAVVTIPKNSSLQFGVWVRTNSSTANVWYGGGPTTETGGGFSFGNSCVIDAVLVNRRKV